MMQWGKWCWRRDSNSQPPDYKSGALPIEPRQRSTVFSRDSCLVNSSNAKIQAFNGSCDSIPDDCPQVELATQSDCLTAEQTLPGVGLVLPKFILSGFSILFKFVSQCWLAAYSATAAALDTFKLSELLLILMRTSISQ